MIHLNFDSLSVKCAHHDYRICARAIVTDKNEQIMLLHYSKNDFYQLPGGGKMAEENLKECVIREIEDETGYKAKILNYLFCAQEDYMDYKAMNYYFLCKAVSPDGIVRRTGYELESDIHIKWFSMQEIVPFIKNHIRQMDTDSYNYRMEQKELCVLEEFVRGNWV